MTGVSEKPTNREKLTYRTTTGIVYAVMVFSIINFISNDHFPFPNGPEGAFVHLGLPHYFEIELTTAKILAVLALLIPSVPFKIKEFAYFGLALLCFRPTSPTSRGEMPDSVSCSSSTHCFFSPC